jgi:hypothetical protein
LRLQNFRLFSPAAGAGNPGLSKLHRFGLLSLLSAAPLLCNAPDFTQTYLYSTYPGATTDNLTIFTATGGTPPLNNGQMGCISWQLLYNSNGLSGVSVNLQSAPSGQGGAVGSWSTFSGTNATGSASLPMTSTSSNAFVSWGYFPWIRVNVATLTGTGSVNIQLSCWKSVIYAGGGGSGDTITSPLATLSVGGSSSNTTIDLVGAQTIYPCTSASGNSTTYTCTTGFSLGAYVTGQLFLWQPDVTCSGFITLNVDGLGAKRIFLSGYANSGILQYCQTDGIGTDSPTLLAYNGYSGGGPSPGFVIVNTPQIGLYGGCTTTNGLVEGTTTNNSIASLTNVTCDQFLTGDGVGHLGGVAAITGLVSSVPGISGCSATLVTGSTGVAGAINSGTTGTCTPVLTWNSAFAYPHGAICDFNDVTTPADTVKQTAYTTTTITASGTTASADIIYYKCEGF